MTQYNQNDVSKNKKLRPYFQKFPGSLTGESTNSKEDTGSQGRQSNLCAPGVTE